MSDQAAAAPPDDVQSFDAIVIGAGFAGLGMLHALRELGFDARVIEAASDVGGTWYWNRYPGARTDSECYYYCFSYPQTLLDDWQWSERYPGWEEALRYLGFVADRLDLRRDIDFDTRVESAVLDEPARRWIVTTDRGARLSAKYVISGMGLISRPYVPEFRGRASFEGESYHTARWPHHDVDFRGRRVGIIGAGATAVQLLPEVAAVAGHVTLFQRTPNFVLPARNHEMDERRWEEIRREYASIWRKTRQHVFAMPFMGSPTGRLAVDATPEAREEIFEKVWREGGFRFVFESFDDLLADPEANGMAADFLRRKIRTVVRDPKTAELLTPKTYPLFAKRPPLDHGYYEAFNRDNVSLVDAADEEPIEEITPKGVRTKAGEHEFDILVYATGFDAYTGAVEDVDIRGRDGISIRDHWRDGPRTFLGLCANGFPNLFMITGPQAPFANIPTMIEENVWWIAACIEYMERSGFDLGEPRLKAVDEWGQRTRDAIEQTVIGQAGKVNSWFLGTNIPTKPPSVLAYFGGGDDYINRCWDVVHRGFEELNFE